MGFVWFDVCLFHSEISCLEDSFCFFFLVVCDCLFDFIFYMKVFADLLVDSQKILMVTVAAALQEIGYEIQVVSFVCFFHLEYGCEESKQCF
jgi:hypothetical protein